MLEQMKQKCMDDNEPYSLSTFVSIFPLLYTIIKQKEKVLFTVTDKQSIELVSLATDIISSHTSLFTNPHAPAYEMIGSLLFIVGTYPLLKGVARDAILAIRLAPGKHSRIHGSNSNRLATDWLFIGLFIGLFG